MASPLRIGSRASRLALIQAEEVARRLRQRHNFAAEDVIITPISTKGDRITQRPLWEMGGKGLFTGQIETRLREKQLDLAVHSMKDLPSRPDDGLAADIMLEREDARDMLISQPLMKDTNGVPSDSTGIRELAIGCRVGTCAPRRMAQLLWLRPDLQLLPVRGNVETRLEKLTRGEVDAILLGCAGLQRLAIVPGTSAVLAPEEMLPAAGQGVIVVQYREDDHDMRELLAPLHHQETGWCVAAEKAFLMELDGSCTTPAGAYAQIWNGRLSLRVRLLSMDGTSMREIARSGESTDAIDIGRRAAAELLRRKPQQRPRLRPEYP